LKGLEVQDKWKEKKEMEINKNQRKGGGSGIRSQQLWRSK
jgi:hypothetical protein